MVLNPLLIVVVAMPLTVAGNTPRLEAQSGDGLDMERAYTIKAAYLFQFGHYVEWPADSFADAESPLVIGVLGPYPFSNVFEEVARTKRIDGRPIIIRRFATMAEYKPYHILFIAASVGPAEIASAIEKLKNAHVLLVGEESKFTELGGIISFYIEESKVRFEINTQAARREQLKISSTLLSLAKIVGPP